MFTFIKHSYFHYGGKNESQSCEEGDICNIDPNNIDEDYGKKVTKKLLSSRLSSSSNSNSKNLSSTLSSYIIPQGTSLFHGSMILGTFNPKNITLGNIVNQETGKRSLATYFSTQKKFAVDRILGCTDPVDKGYIHQFIANKDLKVLILDEYTEGSTWSPEYVYKHYCSSDEQLQSQSQSQSTGKINGVGIVVSHSNDSLLRNHFGSQNDENDQNIKQNEKNYEFILCNPSIDITYVNTQMCLSIRNISEPYNFVK